METLGCSEKFDRNRDQPGRPLNFKILGLKKKSSLQGLAGEVFTICGGGHVVPPVPHDRSVA